MFQLKRKHWISLDMNIPVEEEILMDTSDRDTQKNNWNLLVG